MVLFKGKEQPETLALPKPGAMRKTVGLSHEGCATHEIIQTWVILTDKQRNFQAFIAHAGQKPQKP
jgi:hypothetical protein